MYIRICTMYIHVHVLYSVYIYMYSILYKYNVHVYNIAIFDAEDNNYVYLCVYTCMYYILQKLCDYVSDLLLEESNVQPVSTPITVCGDIHGQVREECEGG